MSSNIVTNEISVDYIKPRHQDHVTIEGFVNSGNVIDPREYGDLGTQVALQDALDACEGEGTVYLAPVAWNLSDDDLTIPSNVYLEFAVGATIHVPNGKSFICNGTIIAGNQKILTWEESGTISFRYTKNSEYPIEWFGAESFDPYIDGPYGGPLGWHDHPDIYSALMKASVALRYTDKRITFSPGLWRLATPIAITSSSQANYNFHIKGSGKQICAIFIDVEPTEVAIALGSDDCWPTGPLKIHDISFVGLGPNHGNNWTTDNCCYQALKISTVGWLYLENVNFWLGSADYACWLENIVWCKAHITGRNALTPGYGDFGEAAKGLGLTNSPRSGGENCLDLYFDSEIIGANPALGMFGNPETVGTWLGSPGGIQRISGCLENADVAFYIENAGLLRIVDLYIEAITTDYGRIGDDSNKLPCIFKYCSEVIIENFLINDGNALEFQYCKNITLNSWHCGGDLIIRQDCRQLSIGHGTINGLIYDYAPDTEYFNGGPVNSYGYAYQQSRPGNVNIINNNYHYNTLFNRWQSNKPDGWESGADYTWTKCGVGCGDTTRHYSTPYCAKIITTSGDPWVYLNTDSWQLQQILGQIVNWGFWMYIPTGTYIWPDESDPTYIHCNASLLYQDATVADWLPNHQYYVGEACRSDNGSGGYANYICVQEGTTGSTKPTWTNTYTVPLEYTTDGTVIWEGGGGVGGSSQPWNMYYGNTNDFVGKWIRINCNGYCPTNATAWGLSMWIKRDRYNTATTMYIAAPWLTIGKYVPRIPTIAPTENIYGIKETYGTTSGDAPTGWRMAGDKHWKTDPSAGASPGWICVSSGNPGTWKTMGVLGS
jgi:hypothetical protein